MHLEISISINAVSTNPEDVAAFVDHMAAFDRIAKAMPTATVTETPRRSGFAVSAALTPVANEETPAEPANDVGQDEPTTDQPDQPPAAEKPKRKRRTKAQIAEDEAREAAERAAKVTEKAIEDGKRPSELVDEMKSEMRAANESEKNAAALKEAAKAVAEDDDVPQVTNSDMPSSMYSLEDMQGFVVDFLTDYADPDNAETKLSEIFEAVMPDVEEQERALRNVPVEDYGKLAAAMHKAKAAAASE